MEIDEARACNLDFCNTGNRAERRDDCLGECTRRLPCLFCVRERSACRIVAVREFRRPFENDLTFRDWNVRLTERTGDCLSYCGDDFHARIVANRETQQRHVLYGSITKIHLHALCPIFYDR